MAEADMYVLRKLVSIALGMWIASHVALGDLMVTNSAGVRAGITGITYTGPTTNSVAIGYAVTDPTGTNVTMFAIQSSVDLTSWTNLTQVVTATGSVSGQASDFAASPAKFYRMYLFNFR